MKTLLISALLLTACGGPFSPKKQCDYGHGLITIQLEEERDCDEVHEIVQEAVTDIIHNGIISRDEMGDALNGMTIWVRRDVHWTWGGDGLQADGEEHDMDIIVGKYMEATAHEMLHRIDRFHGASTDDELHHVKWADPTTNYQKTDDDYALMICRQAGSPGGCG